jgi:glycosyltransferase involved in cell wall biosynthesis
MTWAAARRIPSVLEVNAPLIEEQRTHRELAGEAAARAVARDALGAAGGVVCVSRAVADWAVAHGADTARTRVLANGVDTERIRPRTHRPANVPFTVGFLGTLKPWHGLEVLLEALRTVPDARLLVVGDGPRREDCERRATAYGLDAEFVGAVAPDEVGAQLQRMDVACAPYPDAPGHYFSPLKVFEYLAAGLPVVASRIGQIPELLDRGDSGLLVTPGDPHDLARALRELQTDPARRERLGAAARESALDRHTWRGVVEQALDLVGLPLEASAQVQAS